MTTTLQKLLAAHSTEKITGEKIQSPGKIAPPKIAPPKLPSEKSENEIAISKPPAEKTAQQFSFTPCTCGETIFWLSVSSDQPICVNCEPAPNRAMVKMLFRLAKDSAEPNGWKAIRLNRETLLDEARRPLEPQPSDGLLAFHDADGCLHIRVEKFKHDMTLQQPDESLIAWMRRIVPRSRACRRIEREFGKPTKQPAKPKAALPPKLAANATEEMPF